MSHMTRMIMNLAVTSQSHCQHLSHNLAQIWYNLGGDEKYSVIEHFWAAMAQTCADNTETFQMVL